MGWGKTGLPLLVFALVWLTSAMALAERRTALVIGNAAYTIGPLRNPVNDANDMASTLRQLGFEVTLLRDVNRRAMQEAIDAFNHQLRQGGVGLFYFAGHGVQVGGENYLIPLGVSITREQDVQYEAVPAGRVLGAMEDAGNQLNIVILDACRDNPFARHWRSSQRGLAVVQAARGVLIAYATAPGAVSIDGEGRNGLYTSHLLRYMTAPGLSVEHVFKQVRTAVVEASGGQQMPWESSSLMGNFFFAPEKPSMPTTGVRPTPPSTPPASGPTEADPETLMWTLAEQSTHPEDVRAFLDTYPNSRFAPVARLKLQQLQRQAGQPTGLQAPPEPPPQLTPQVARGDSASVGSEQKVGQFIVYGNGTALDTKTTLMWMTKDFRNLEGRAPASWNEAIAWVEKMNQQRYGGYSDWRVPTPEEYKTVYQATTTKRSAQGSPVSYPEVFADQGGVWCWSAEELEVASFFSRHRQPGEPQKNEAYGFNFRTGTSSPREKSFGRGEDSIRLVRRGS